ncbi:DUF6993 domain-containing protein [Microbacterium sp. PA5]|uniref:DUF6993 domain-containing protein n=1 Tax=Microbacterium sp. PA5 TaxID=3416654 RepID=UPI003CE7AA4B
MRRLDPRPCVVAVAVLAAIAALTGCAPDAQPGPGPAASETVASPTDAATPSSPTPTPSPTEPALDPDGSAEDNLPLFTEVVEKVWKTDDRVKGRAYIDALVRAGFDKASMEVTKDRSSVGIPADSIQFSVRWTDACLVGQVGPSTKKPAAVVLPHLPTGGCLVGETRPIDW